MEEEAKRLELIEDIARQLDKAKFHRVTLGCLEIVLYRDGEAISASSVGTILGYLVGGIWQDGDATDIRGCDAAVVRTL